MLNACEEKEAAGLSKDPTRFIRLHGRLEEAGRFPMWVIYLPITREYPGKWVARLHVALPEPRPTRFVATGATKEELLAMIPQGLVNIGRSPADPQEIAEVWL